MTDPHPTPADILIAEEAVELSRLSLSTLLRRGRDGHPIGLRRNGRRLLFVRAELVAYLTRTNDPNSLPSDDRL